MIQIRFALLAATFLSLGNTTTQAAGESPFVQQSQSAPPSTSGTHLATSESATPSIETNAGRSTPSELTILETKVRPAVIWVTTFDPKGNLLRTASAFFVSADGRFVTTARAIDGAINAVVKTGDGGIYNVSGILAASKGLDLAVLQADVKPRKLLRFLDLNKTGELRAGASIAVVGCRLAGNEGSARETTITTESPDRLDIAGAMPSSSIGAPLVDENGDVVGVVTSTGEKTMARPVAALDSLLSAVVADTQPHWPGVAEVRATPHPTSKPRLIYAPAPSFPPGQSLPGGSETGRFRLTFDPQGNVTDIQIVTSTGNPYFDQSAVKTLRQWRSAPSQGWQAIVPVTFRAR
jgi:TonB family protein